LHWGWFFCKYFGLEVDAETKESTRKTEEKMRGRYKEGHEQKKPK